MPLPARVVTRSEQRRRFGVSGDRCSGVRCRAHISQFRASRVNRWNLQARLSKHQLMEIRIQCLCIDTADPARIASFWESALGWRRTFEEEDQVCLEPPVGSPEDCQRS